MNKCLKSVACIAAVCLSLSAFAQTEEEKQIPAVLTFVNNTSGDSAINMQIIPPVMQTFTTSNPITMKQSLAPGGGSATTELTPKNPTMEIYFIVSGVKSNPHNIPPDCRFYLTYDAKTYHWKLKHYPESFKCKAECTLTDKYTCKITAG